MGFEMESNFLFSQMEIQIKVNLIYKSNSGAGWGGPAGGASMGGEGPTGALCIGFTLAGGGGWSGVAMGYPLIVIIVASNQLPLLPLPFVVFSLNPFVNQTINYN
jgi:hypothetical protein